MCKEKKAAYKEFAKMNTFERECNALTTVCCVCKGSKMAGADLCYQCEQEAPEWVYKERDPNDDGRLFQYER